MTDSHNRDAGARAPTRREFLERGARAAAGLGVLGMLPGSLLTAPTSSALSAIRRDGSLTLGNDIISASWSVSDGVLRATGVTGKRDGTRLSVPAQVFTLTLADGARLDSTRLRVAGEPTIESVAPRPGASRLSERIPGRRITVALEDPARRVMVAWSAELCEGSHYIRQEIVLRALGAPLPVREIALVELSAPGAKLTGSVKGSPVTIDNWFAGFEHPLSTSTVEGTRVRCFLSRELPLRPESPVAVSSVIGIARPGQMRRDFLAYVERERAHPYRTFLHYNSWYDIGYFSKYSEAEALAVIQAFGTELVRKRDVVLDSFLFDDGWDDPKTLWGFHDGFSHGFAKVREEAARYGAAPGVWLSPWGGYGDPKKARLEYGRQQGFETNEGGFALSGPKYYERFRETCVRMVREYGVNQFKIDGTGNAAHAIPGSAFDSDFDAAIHLIEELREARPDIYVNLTTGTYPSPFWLRYADSIWRGGEDHDFAGVGSDRQQWITYRDADSYANVVKRGALFPINSLMLHGIIYARHAKKLDIDPHRDLGSEIRSYFGTGTQLQEMYVTPVLTPAVWDTLAECAKWSRANADTLVDTHWIGGDPAKLEPYGWASWSKQKGIITLRNPSDKPGRFALDVQRAFELPDEAPRSYAARSPWAGEAGRAQIQLAAGQEHVIELAPFEVLTLEATPR
ncbi:MAG TPA: hypothetical protein VFR95_14215 [Gemmatimonadaceae bacterium]|nr:hypothetical protein [Gemmatimonadaceae bacterium]